MKEVDVVVIGAGAAGLMCAITAAQRGRNVVVLEGSNKIGKKILMSGGGRCNFTNQHTDPACFLGENPHFCKSALSRYTQWDFIALVERHGIAYHEKTLGQLFCDVSSKDIVAMLSRECELAGVTILTESKEIKIDSSAGLRVSCSHKSFSTESIVVASGGLSIPKMGASGLAYEIAEQFGIECVETRAGLVPFTLTGALLEMSSRLAGVSCDVSVSANGVVFAESMLFTHRGLSGPAILQASSYWLPGDTIEIDLLPSQSAGKILMAARKQHPKSLVRTALAGLLPKALLLELEALLWPASRNKALADLGNVVLADIDRKLHAWQIKPAATEGYRTAEVTLGGVNTDELSSKTMQARKQPGLYFIGEAIDVTGHLGGFNFQWAWSSGWVAGQNA